MHATQWIINKFFEVINELLIIIINPFTCKLSLGSTWLTSKSKIWQLNPGTAQQGLLLLEECLSNSNYCYKIWFTRRFGFKEIMHTFRVSTISSFQKPHHRYTVFLSVLIFHHILCISSLRPIIFKFTMKYALNCVPLY